MAKVWACLGEAGVAELVHKRIQPCGQQRLGAHRRKHLAQRRLAVAGQCRAFLPGVMVKGLVARATALTPAITLVALAAHMQARTTLLWVDFSLMPGNRSHFYSLPPPKDGCKLRGRTSTSTSTHD